MTEEQITEIKKHFGDECWIVDGRVNYGFRNGHTTLEDYHEVVAFDVIDGVWFAFVMSPYRDEQLPFMMQHMFRGDGDTPIGAYNDLLDSIMEFAKDVGVTGIYQ